MRNSRRNLVSNDSYEENKDYFENKSKNPRAIIFGSDQSPSNSKNAHWINFLNQIQDFFWCRKIFKRI